MHMMKTSIVRLKLNKRDYAVYPLYESTLPERIMGILEYMALFYSFKFANPLVSFGKYSYRIEK